MLFHKALQHLQIPSHDLAETLPSVGSDQDQQASVRIPPDIGKGMKRIFVHSARVLRAFLEPEHGEQNERRHDGRAQQRKVQSQRPHCRRALLFSEDQGQSFELHAQADRAGIAKVLQANDGALILVGEMGVKRLELPGPDREREP